MRGENGAAVKKSGTKKTIEDVRTVNKKINSKSLDDDKSLQSFEIKVFSREPLNRMTGEKLFVTFSPHDFSICYSIPREKSDS